MQTYKQWSLRFYLVLAAIFAFLLFMPVFSGRVLFPHSTGGAFMLPIVMVVFVVMLIAKPPAHFILKIVGLIVATFYYLLAVQFMAQLNMWVAVVFVVAMAVALVWRTHLGWGKWWENL